MSNLPAPAPGSLRDFLRTSAVQDRFREVMSDKAPQFIASLASLIYRNPKLGECDRNSVIAAALVAASLDLPVDANLGFSYIVPYKGIAQFQMGYKGYIQLALRTGQYKTINSTEVYTGEVRGVNRFTGEIIFGDRTGDDITGYLAYIKLLNGFEKFIHMTKAEVDAHARRHSKTYDTQKGEWYKNSLWDTNFDAMAKKTVLRHILTKWGVMSVEMRRAIGEEAPPDEPEPEEKRAPNAETQAATKSALWGDETSGNGNGHSDPNTMRAEYDLAAKQASKFGITAEPVEAFSTEGELKTALAALKSALNTARNQAAQPA